MSNYEAKQEIRYAERRLSVQLTQEQFEEAVRLVEKYAMDPWEAVEISQ